MGRRKPEPRPRKLAQADRRAGASRPEAAQAETDGGSLDAYRAKRNFRLTPEPAAGVDGKVAGSTGSARYVIHKHWARRLHYDLRLEVGGCLKSWAVPKGPSLDPADKRLAVAVEDHPLAYGDFEGRIPAGQYGAGDVIIWDRGRWTADGDAAAGLAAGRLRFALHGIKLRGWWLLVRMHGKERGAGGANWLLVKERDAAARAASAFDVTQACPDSVGPAAEAAASSAADLPRAALPQALAPQLARLASRAPGSPSLWQWEIKFDGYRLLARVCKRGSVRLFTRNGLDWTARMPELAQSVAALELRSSWLDGEVVMPGADGVPDFAALQRAFSTRRSAQLLYYLFDAPFLRGADLRPLPLAQRRAQLDAALAAVTPAPSIRLSAALDGDPRSLLASACRMGLEGIVGKRRDSGYRSGRSTDWVKLKCVQEDEFVVVGLTAGQGERAASDDLGALVLAAPDEQGQLRWAGNVGTGLDAAERVRLKRRLLAHPLQTSPLARGESVPAAVQWTRPELVAQVRHAGLTPEGHVRQAVFRGLREDRQASEVLQPAAGTLDDEEMDMNQDNGRAGCSGTRADAVAQQLTHADRVMDPDSGTTKLALACYYADANEVMLPHLEQRPVALLRAPDGVQGETFFQKHASGRQLPHVKLLDEALDPGHEPLLEMGSEAALISAVQMNVVELHTWNARSDRIDRPDRFVLDLDPGEGVAWEQVQEAAQLLHTLITELELVPFVKTSGGKGLHVVTPIKRLYDWDTVKAFSRQLTEHLARLMPDRFTAVSGPRNRVGRIFADYLRNGRGATTVAAWSVRARPGMGVSVPFSWQELDQVSGGAHWHMGNVRRRLAVGNEPWADYPHAARALGPARKIMDRLAS